MMGHEGKSDNDKYKEIISLYNSLDEKTKNYLYKRKNLRNMLVHVKSNAINTFSDSEITIKLTKVPDGTNKKTIVLTITSNEGKNEFRQKQEVFENNCFYKELAKIPNNILLHYKNKNAF